MTPAAKPALQPREVKREGEGRGAVKIVPSGRGAKATINIAWLCGGSRTFTIDELRALIELADGPGAKHSIWLNPSDHKKSKFFVQLKDGKLTANDGMSENGFVAWTDLKRELQATIADILS